MDLENDEVVNLANAYRPSAIGLSFMLDRRARGCRVIPRAAVYEATTVVPPGEKYRKTTWHRRDLRLEPVLVALGAPRGSDETLAEGLKLHVRVRSSDEDRSLVTVSLYNSTTENRRSRQTYYQVGFSVESLEPDGFVEYRRFESATKDEEERALDLLYRKRRVFAIGHGCAASWTPAAGPRTSEVHTAVLPSVTVPPLVPLMRHERWFSMEFLRGDGGQGSLAIPFALDRFCEDYASWVDRQATDVPGLEERYRAVGSDHVELCRTTLHRMRAGVELLRRDEDALEAFALVNRVMLMQQHHSRLRRRLSDEWRPLPGPDDYKSDWSEKKGYWRAFQLAFILMVLPSLVAEHESIDVLGESVIDRDLVDLIWFPTGGGKTEAYLALSAFSIFYSRLTGSSRSGTLVLMRYTLRLLTTQQFQRAASLVCACELIRQERPGALGGSPISIGLWVGQSLTPNDEKDATTKVAKLGRLGEVKNPFQLLSCPWCGTELDNRDRLGYDDHLGRMVFTCPSGEHENGACPFSRIGRYLPVSVVDESIYREPPTLLIGTVDKFAMLAWRDEATRIFEEGGGPRLIIQDELHLISGPLGSMVGLYESVIDFMCRRGSSRPKIIASTATIRRAKDQCRGLYDRHVFQFPPPGLDISDSYFAFEDESSPGRQYVGFLPTAASSPLTAQIRAIVSLQQGVFIVGNEAPDDALDPYWTLVQYFGSLKELGRAATFISADIPEFLPTMHRRYEVDGHHRRWMRTSEELTSRKNEDEIPKILKRLEMKYRRDVSGDEQALDTVLATNMISVGVDVERLGLMMIVTQPKGTSEYIQASSRVGRSSASPGLILTLFNAGRPRDRSHYEQFQAYHESFYRFVEPTSVTPFAPPAMDRALAGVLVVAARHAAKWKEPTAFDRDDDTLNAFIAFLRRRVERVDPEHLEEFEASIEGLLNDWEIRKPARWGRLSGTRDEPMLFRVAGTSATEQDPDSWEVPTSMRNVDVECSAQVIANYSRSSLLR